MSQNLKIKIAFVLPNLNLEGAQNMAVQLAVMLDPDKFEPVFFILNESVQNTLYYKLCTNNILCHFYGKRNKNSLIRKFQIAKWLFGMLEKEKENLIHVHLDYYSWIYALLYRKRIIITVHSQPYRIYNTFTNLVYRKLYKKNLVLPILLTEGLAREFSDLFRVSVNDIAVIANPVNLNRFRRNKTVLEDDLVFCSIGRFHSVKNYHALITAFAIAVKQNSQIRLRLIGTGPLMEREIEYVKVLKIGNKVEFLGEISEVEKELCRVDVYVNSSISEAFPMTILEAMAAGLPIIATDVGSIGDIINGSGIIVPPDDPELMAEAMLKMASDKRMRVSYGDKALNAVSEYDIEKIAIKYMKLYEAELKHKMDEIVDK